MKQIKDYVEVMFRELPKTPDVLDMKQNILNSMEDKYDDYIDHGVSESEAIGRVIGEFGSIDEIKEALSIDDNPEEYLDSQRLNEFLEFFKTFSKMISIAVFMIFVGLTLVYILSSLNYALIGAGVFFIILALSVFIFIVFGIRHSGYADVLKSDKALYYLDMENLEQLKQNYLPRFGITIASGVALVIVSMMLFFVSSEVVKFETIGPVIFLLGSGIGVGLISDVAMTYSVYTELLSNNKNRNKIDITGPVMGITAMIYLLIGFTTGWWHPTWIMFPVVAIFFGSIEDYLNRRNKETSQ